MLDEQPSAHEDSFKQFVFENANFNIRTLDDMGLFTVCVVQHDHT